MSRQLASPSSITMLTAMISLLLSAQTGQAATVGATKVNSALNEPLSASINISDIDANSFSASVAPPSVYQQMTMSTDVPISVQFIKTSETSGKLILNSSTTVSKPFADVVLILNENGKMEALPKTLLLPISSTQPASIADSRQAIRDGNHTRPNLPTSNLYTPNSSNNAHQSMANPVTSTSSVIDSTPTFNHPTYNKPVSNQSTSKPYNTTTTRPSSANTSQVNTLNPNNTDIQSEILTMRISRHFIALNSQSSALKNNSTAAQNQTNTLAPIATPNTGVHANSPNFAQAHSSTDTTNTESVSTNANANSVNHDAEHTKTATTQPKTNQIGLSKVTYTVQRNDNLWTIASQIARRNNIDVHTVMKQIQSYNQNAFIDNNPSLLKAESKIAIPDYKVIPSRLGIRAATSAKQTSTNEAPLTSQSSSTDTQVQTSSQRPTTRPLPKPSVTLVAPSSSGSATGSSSTNAQGTGISSALVARVRQTREQTANEARRVAELNSQLTQYTHKLQLQNERLGDLEQRLKQLRNQ